MVGPERNGCDVRTRPVLPTYPHRPQHLQLLQREFLDAGVQPHATVTVGKVNLRRANLMVEVSENLDVVLAVLAGRSE
jgi:hypothetical protein